MWTVSSRYFCFHAETIFTWVNYIEDDKEFHRRTDWNCLWQILSVISIAFWCFKFQFFSHLVYIFSWYLWFVKNVFVRDVDEWRVLKVGWFWSGWVPNDWHSCRQPAVSLLQRNLFTTIFFFKIKLFRENKLSQKKLIKPMVWSQQAMCASQNRTQE